MHTHSFWSDAMLVFTGVGGISAIGHIVNTFPTPKNVYGQWLLGSLQYIVGQRVQAQQTASGQANVMSMAKDAISPPAKIEVIAEPIVKP